ncbi:hypothetical protein HOS47_gp03 [Pseudomonas phage uligo]|uniref:Uncharacterized protein n=1 Tax=Pseudomonas phage uligo TaxID=2048979 RepID=A0A2R4LAQ3_9CAUD|nr:hypothetical protein HOS47_gp03 [Pseudomonas phage uligo]AVV96147.1 hypothetical protein [Pseudomonas phage uligo]
MRLRETCMGLGGDFAKVYRDSVWNEFVVKFYSNGVKLKDADYHTDTLHDAKGTANNWLNEQDDKRRK